VSINFPLLFTIYHKPLTFNPQKIVLDLRRPSG
jgi:hypothetical protein